LGCSNNSSQENTPDSPPEMFDLLGLMAESSDSEDEEWWTEGESLTSLSPKVDVSSSFVMKISVKVQTIVQ
jgi:hypothetical protein